MSDRVLLNFNRVEEKIKCKACRAFYFFFLQQV